jgi:ParB family chromosome partitioning protein
LGAWIESNVLLQLASVPFDKQDETLVPAAGSCFNCPKRTGFNKLLFADVRKDSCTDPQCFRAKVNAHVTKTLENKPELVQISSAWNTREGAPLGRNRYVELQIKKPKSNGSATKQSPFQKACEKMSEAIVMDGGNRGQIVKVCADPNCRVHHSDRPSPQQLQRDRAQERKRIEKEKIAVTARHRILAAILERVSVPMKKADLLTVAQHVLSGVPHNRIPLLAKRHKLEIDKSSASPVELLQKHISHYDESALSGLMLEISLLESAYRSGGDPDSDFLLNTAKRYRIDAEKVQKAVAEVASARSSEGANDRSGSFTCYNLRKERSPRRPGPLARPMPDQESRFAARSSSPKLANNRGPLRRARIASHADLPGHAAHTMDHLSRASPDPTLISQHPGFFDQPAPIHRGSLLHPRFPCKAECRSQHLVLHTPAPG